jgi:nitrate/TMAO reductase-like tetraheme cytochrome c subunit
MPIRIRRKHDDHSHLEDDEKPSPPRLIFNGISIAGIIIAVGSISSLFFFIILDSISHDAGGYAGVMYIAPTLITFIGIGIAFLGRVAEKKHREHGKPPTISGQWHLELNLGLFTHPKIVLIALLSTIGVTMTLMTLGAGSIGMIEYTESNEFCAETCHFVMSPEATVYEDSPHARVACVECHVGHGAQGFIEAKVNGLRQVYGVVSGDFSRPIPTPIHNRRSSLEMCESCHWKDRFVDYKVMSRQYFHADEENTPSEIKLLLKIGGEKGGGLVDGSGIHYHMLSKNKVEFIARDEERQDIPFVRVTSEDGKVTEYNNTDEPLSDEERAELTTHQVECMDCHSRPAHQFAKPMDSINKAIAAGSISRDLPYIKLQSVKLLDTRYETKPEALKEISYGLTGYYNEEYPEVLTEQKDELLQAVTTLQDIYNRTIFPEMRADWSAHPNNIGHRDSPGCFRCHNDVMESDDGEAIFTDCTKCHAILAQGENIIETRADFQRGQVFVHLDDDEEFDDFELCTDCHDGGFGAYEDL